MSVTPKIAPSMLSSDFANLASEAHRMLTFGADWLHMDIMAVISAEKECQSCVIFNNNKRINQQQVADVGFARYSFLISAAVNSEPHPHTHKYHIHSASARCFHPVRPENVDVCSLSLTSEDAFFQDLKLGKENYFINLVAMDVLECVPFSPPILCRHFVPNLTLGAPIIESLRKHTKAYLDCHLMVTNPLDYVEPLGKAGASGFTFHIETSKDNWEELIQRIKAQGMRPGVALKPGTPVGEVYSLVEAENPVEMVLVMTVEPGFGGQKFMPEMMDKVRTLRKKYPSLDIEVDGGLGPSTIDAAASAGANCIVAGSSVFGAPEPAQVISLLRNSVEKSQQTH
ncbi:hypothetical protein Lal_00002618 [Lupinus albus]|nr:hypothetical protein Lal_00002618 [Lupinus albus]